MKKNIRIVTLILLIILLAIGITTSIASSDEYYNQPTIDFSAETLTVTKDTTAQQMLDALNAGKTLTGISYKVKSLNESIYCRERHWYLYSKGRYQLVDRRYYHFTWH